VKRELLYGKTGRFVGVFPFLKALEEKRYKQYIRVFLRHYQLAKVCPACGGSRLNSHALAVRIGADTIAAVAARPVGELAEWIDRLALGPTEQAIATDIRTELESRLGYLDAVGLGYLTMDRQTRTL